MLSTIRYISLIIIMVGLPVLQCEGSVTLWDGSVYFMIFVHQSEVYPM
jgi:hypothetical protein